MTKKEQTEKDKLFRALARFLRANVTLVADYRDSNAPWNLLTRLQIYEETYRGTK